MPGFSSSARVFKERSLTKTALPFMLILHYLEEQTLWFKELERALAPITQAKSFKFP